MPLVMMPWVNHRWNSRYTTVSGTADTVVAAISGPQAVASLRMLASPRTIVMMSGLLTTTSGHRKSFRPVVNARTPSAATAAG